MQVTNSTNLWQNLQSLAGSATAQLQNNQPFTVSVPATDPSASAAGGPTGAATLSGKFQYTMIEKAGNNTLFNPEDPSAPTAGTAEFADQLQNFLSLAQAGGQLTGPSTFQSSGSFYGDGGQYGITWSNSLNLQPGDSASGVSST